MACADAEIMQQETDFLIALEEISGFMIDENGELLLSDASDDVRLVFLRNSATSP